MRCRGLGRAPALFGGRSQEKPCYFRGGAMLSLAALATRNLTTVFALILMASPVCGLRPMRALRSAFFKRPMPGITKTPFFFVSLMAVSASRSRKAAACLLVSSSFSARRRVNAVFVNPDAMRILLKDQNVALGFRSPQRPSAYLKTARAGAAWRESTEATCER